MKIVTIGAQQTEIDPREHGIEIVAVRADEMDLRVEGRLHVVPYAVQGTTISFSFDGEIYFAEVTEKGARAKARHRDASMAAPMPGLVLKILVRQGDVVAKGAPLLILEAMKMEHQIAAPRDGKIAAIHCAEGELVQPGVDLITLEDS
ncbi:MAG TPA: acetyl-CoA carboxylase biotin carboxyl carrier protein subunit [Thermoanaerobaculia bacterium]|nr:acetyl-CoA carboxylase biotin carboxyl carrier protein subunit [Thermoanaerobaculia bacterium]